MKSRFFYGEQPIDLLEGVKSVVTTPLRVVFFGSPIDSEQYCELKVAIAQAIDRCFGESAPVWSLIVQPPFESGLIAEVWWGDSADRVEYKQLDETKYIVVHRGEMRRVMVGGLSASLDKTIAEQSRAVCDSITQIITTEQLEVSDIVRQWNYIEQITGEDRGGQHYQSFNDARSELYGRCEWGSGYPAATGIGTVVGGVVIDLDIVQGEQITPIDNRLQVSAHNYSKQVLIGEHESRSTPKFERAKLVGDLLYISGTAAIRGEESLVGVGAGEQTRITLDNIDELLSASESGDISSLRVYIKREEDYTQVREVVEQYVANQAIYVFADICREELLVEIEAIAYKIIKK
ncbi:MAG: Rid family hydrolase [Rikenellaceae bacterium]